MGYGVKMDAGDDWVGITQGWESANRGVLFANFYGLLTMFFWHTSRIVSRSKQKMKVSVVLLQSKSSGGEVVCRCSGHISKSWWTANPSTFGDY
jgi:hypothetical protein